jgi:hypothetical protein
VEKASNLYRALRNNKTIANDMSSPSDALRRGVIACQPFFVPLLLKKLFIYSRCVINILSAIKKVTMFVPTAGKKASSTTITVIEVTKAI